MTSGPSAIIRGVASFSFAFLFVASSFATVNSETQRAAEQAGAAAVSQVNFDKGAAALKLDEVNELKAAIEEARKNGKIEKVQIVAWPDREYVGENEKASKADMRLAEDRADQVKKYLKELNISRVSVYNMAKRPNSLQEIFKTPTAKVKDTLERTGAAPTSPEGTGLLGMSGKASSALILVYR